MAGTEAMEAVKQREVTKAKKGAPVRACHFPFYPSGYLDPLVWATVSYAFNCPLHLIVPQRLERGPFPSDGEDTIMNACHILPQFCCRH